MIEPITPDLTKRGKNIRLPDFPSSPENGPNGLIDYHKRLAQWYEELKTVILRDLADAD